jgi:small subunit ribosomal protein S6
VYVYLKYVGDGALVSELERNLRLQDAVLKFQTVKISDAAQAVAAKPDEIEFEHLDVVEDTEPEDSVAKTLGLEGGRDDFRPESSEIDEPEEASADAEEGESE